MDLEELTLTQPSYLTFEFPNTNDVGAIRTVLDQALQTSKKQGIFRLLLHVPKRPGPAFNDLQVFRLITNLLNKWDHRIWVAVILDYQSGPLEEFGLLVAHNRGINARIFATLADALAWFGA